MCSIMGYCAGGVAFSDFKAGFDETISRGPDDSRIIDTGDGLLGFHRLAIMGLDSTGMQPFELDGSYCVCNGEIYGFERMREQLSKKYTFVSGSDCEILLPMYREYGTDMFAKLDAEFALIIYDAEHDEYIAARDPIGIRPLYYGYSASGAPVFASEPKNLVGLCERIMPFPPGHYWKDGEFRCYADMSHVKHFCTDDLDEICVNIHNKLVAGVEKRLVADAKVGFLLSGGLDSSLVCSIAAKRSEKPIRTFAIGMDIDAIDLGYARQVAEYIGSEHTEVIMTRQQVLDSLETVIRILGTYDITTIRASMGQYLLRRAFVGDYLPESILMREKAAFSDAVGHSMVDDLKEYAEEKYTDDEFEHRRKRYTHAQPFTKESLLYREIFEKYYPGQSEMVVDFWMPNRNWEGCDVNDPSARVLSNYGDSGK